MKIYMLLKGGSNHHHFDKKTAEDAIKRIYYTTKDGVEHHGAHWSMEQVLNATSGMKFKDCVTDYDKYVAFNAAYADFNKVLQPEQILEAGHAFFFDDEDAPCNKVWLYMKSW